jgi:hypothetical protein
MLKKYFILIIVVLIGCNTNQKLIRKNDISSIIYYSKQKCLSRKIDKYFYNARKHIENKLNFINYVSDTVYVIQTIDPESSEHFESIWNHNGIVEYSWYINKISSIGVHNFMNRLYTLIENWDLETIKKEEVINKSSINGRTLFAMKIIINNNSFKCDCIEFEAFFNPKVDHYFPK